MGDILKLTIALLMVSAAAGLAIAFTYKQTAEKIEYQEMLVEQQALTIVFPEGTKVTKQDATSSLPDPYWIGEKEGTIIGYAFKGSGKGYSSDIKFIVGIDPEGTILGLTVLSQEETPGLGTRVEEVVSKKYLWNGLFGKKERDFPWFTKQFRGINVTKDIAIDKSSEWHNISEEKKKDLLNNNSITAITGATISTGAVSKGIKQYAYKYLSALKSDDKKAVENNPEQEEQ
jgi:RnfABCDGE-type electron transport complex G subunit